MAPRHVWGRLGLASRHDSTRTAQKALSSTLSRAWGPPPSAAGRLTPLLGVAAAAVRLLRLLCFACPAAAAAAVACLQTGTAERFSKQLGNELRRKYGDGVVVEVVDIENYKAETRLPKEKLVLYLMATYGECARQAAAVESEQQAGDEESSRLGAVWERCLAAAAGAA